jgi:NTP pyrophosphatase (non-canonical NTP hydrolase)
MEHFNELTPAQAELLALLAEECGECIQAIGKILRHGYASANPLRPGSMNNADVLAKEMGDVRAAMIMLCNAGPVSKEQVHSNADTKLANVGRWLHHQAPNVELRGRTLADGPA